MFVIVYPSYFTSQLLLLLFTVLVVLVCCCLQFLCFLSVVVYCSCVSCLLLFTVHVFLVFCCCLLFFRFLSFTILQFFLGCYVLFQLVINLLFIVVLPVASRSLLFVVSLAYINIPTHAAQASGTSQEASIENRRQTKE